MLIETPNAPRKANRTAHMERLTRALGDGREWQYVGVSVRPRPDGTCICGHSGIRYECHLYRARDKKTAIVGTSCVEVYADAIPELVAQMRADVARIEAEHADRLKKAKAAAEQDQVKAAIAEIEAILWKRGGLIAAAYRRRMSGEWLPTILYREGARWSDRVAKREAGEPVEVAHMPAMKTAKGLLARLDGMKRRAQIDLEDAQNQLAKYL